MSYLDTASGQIVAAAPELEHAAFIRRTYTHLAGAIPGVCRPDRAVVARRSW